MLIGMVAITFMACTLIILLMRGKKTSVLMDGCLLVGVHLFKETEERE